MKFHLVLIASSLSLGLCAISRAQQPAVAPAAPAAPAPAVAAPPLQNFTEAQLVEELGWLMAKRVGLTELELTKENVAGLLKGVQAAVEGKDSPYDLQACGPSMDEFMQRKQTAYIGRMKQKSTAEAAAFTAKLKENPKIVTTPSGLAYEVIVPGTGPAPKPDDTVVVNYTGALVNGQVFDSSEKSGKPAEFVLNQVIPGWTEGLQKISKGGKMKLYIPPQLAYGDQGQQGIPPGSTLVFDVELVDIKAK